MPTTILETRAESEIRFLNYRLDVISRWPSSERKQVTAEAISGRMTAIARYAPPIAPVTWDNFMDDDLNTLSWAKTGEVGRSIRSIPLMDLICRLLDRLRTSSVEESCWEPIPSFLKYFSISPAAIAAGCVLVVNQLTRTRLPEGG